MMNQHRRSSNMETSSQIEEGTVMSYPDHENFVILAIGNEPGWFLVQIIGENIPYWTKRSMAFPILGKDEELLERGRRLATEQGLPLQLQNY